MEHGLSAKWSHGSGSQTEPEEEVLEQDTGWDQCPCLGFTVLFTVDRTRGHSPGGKPVPCPSE